MDHLNSIFTRDYTNRYGITVDPDKTCCVCFESYHIITERTDRCNKHASNEHNNCNECNRLTLSDIDPNAFVDDRIPPKCLVLSCCKIHYICIECLHRIANDYSNHAINESNSHIPCPYPFTDCVTTIGFRNVFTHESIKKICTPEEWRQYRVHAERFAFPGFNIIKCPMTYYSDGNQYLCNSDILVENELIRTTQLGELLIECSQNDMCMKRFCFNCKQSIHYYVNACHECKTTTENENPNVYNYYINRNVSDALDTFCEPSSDTHNYDESSYLYLNKNITVEIAVQQVLDIYTDVNTYMICCICKLSLYKTERCNGLSHHNIERCYACGRIGSPVRGLGEHWNTSGIAGCYRFDTDYYIKRYIPEYVCNDTFCFSHERGDCAIPEHQNGSQLLYTSRLRAYIYHLLKSLSVTIRFDVYDYLYNLCITEPTVYNDLLPLLPYKQTLIILSIHKRHYLDYSEMVVYDRLECTYPGELQEYQGDKSYYVEATEYLSKYSTSFNDDTRTSSTSNTSNTRTVTYSNQTEPIYVPARLQPIITRRITLTPTNETNILDNLIHDTLDQILNSYRFNYSDDSDTSNILTDDESDIIPDTRDTRLHMYSLLLQPSDVDDSDVDSVDETDTLDTEVRTRDQNDLHE